MEQAMKADSALELDAEPGRPQEPPAPWNGWEWAVPDRGGEEPPPMPVWDAPRWPAEHSRGSLAAAPSIPPMTEEAARTALLRFLNSKCCYGSKAAGELVIQELKQLTVYRYRLETFHESRLSEWAFEPFPPAGRPRGAAPLPGPPRLPAPPPFRERTRRLRLPHAALVKECHGCHGHGRSKCSVCHGAGWTRCVTCKGSRRSLKQQKRCQLCSGTGRKRCNTCSGRGSKTCAMCQGEKKLQHFKQLVITWRNNVFEFVSAHQLDLPGELLSRVNGENVFRDENVQVYPVADFPEPEICLASQRAVAEHSAAFAASSRILQQRQTIELIPVTEVRYRHAGKPYACYVYGLEEEVHAADYPARCCRCGCCCACALL